MADQSQAENEVACLRAGLRERGFVRDYELTCLTKHGQRVVVELTQTQLTVDGGRILGTSAILRNITQRKEAEAIVNEERARIARDLHDGVAQTLYFLALKTDLCRKLLGQDPDRVHQELLTIKQSLQHSIRDVRSTIFALRPLDLRRLGFWGGTQQFITAFGEQHALAIDFRVSGNKHSLSPSLEPTLFRLIQESLNNVGKHADARHVWIELGLDQCDSVSLSIGDDGRGFQMMDGNDHRSGLGLSQMRERVEALGGTFEIRSRPGQGTIVSAQFPLVGITQEPVYEVDSNPDR